MTTITLEAIKAEQTRLAAMIAELSAAPIAEATHYTVDEVGIVLQPGERYAGLLLDNDGSPSHHLVLLPGEAEEVSWQAAKAWATSSTVGELPTRREQSLLFANLKGEFQAAWYWSAEEYETDRECAWAQGFYDGYQFYGH